MLFVALPIVTFSIFCLLLICVNLINICFSMSLLGFILYGTVCTSWTWVTISFPLLEKFLTVISSDICSGHLYFSSSSGTPIVRMLVHLMLSQSSLILFIFFFFFILFYSRDFHHSVFQVTCPFFCLSCSSIDSFSAFFILVILLFFSVCF